MRVALFSDLNTDFWSNNFKEELINPHKPNVIVLAGNIAVGTEGWIWFLKHLRKKYPTPIILGVPGAKEFYTKELRAEYNAFVDLEEKFDGFFLLDNNSVHLNEYVFLGGTLWTEYRHQSDYQICRQQVNDFQQIKVGDRMFDIPDSQAMFASTKNYIFDTIARLYREEEQTKKNTIKIVVTHHAPSLDCRNDTIKYTYTNPLNSAHFNQLDSDIDKSPSNFWMHGSTKESIIKEVYGKTKLLANPFGYLGHDINKDFNPGFIIDV